MHPDNAVCHRQTKTVRGLGYLGYILQHLGGDAFSIILNFDIHRSIKFVLGNRYFAAVLIMGNAVIHKVEYCPLWLSMARAGVWYTKNGTVEDSVIEAPKTSVAAVMLFSGMIVKKCCGPESLVRDIAIYIVCAVKE